MTYFWGLSPEDLRWFAFAILGSIAAFAAVRPLQVRFEKHHLVVVCSLFNLAIGFGSSGCALRARSRTTGTRSRW